MKNYRFRVMETIGNDSEVVQDNLDWEAAFKLYFEHYSEMVKDYKKGNYHYNSGNLECFIEKYYIDENNEEDLTKDVEIKLYKYIDKERR